MRTLRVLTCISMSLWLATSAQAHFPWINMNDEGSMDSFADLPFEVTSFGAARVGNKAYIYGGHTGSAHSYSNEEQSNQLFSLDLSGKAKEWELESTGQRLQGLAMVAHKSHVILIGGFTAKNAPGEDHQLESQTDVRAFDTASKTWSELPPLPKGRSSHDAAIIGDTIYVVGGWTMAVDQETEWHDTAIALDLSEKNPQWKELPSPPFQRRALATVAHEGKLYVIGGMNKEGGPTRAVAIFDPAKTSWLEGPELHGKSPMAGFGAAGWSVGGKLVASTYEGDVLNLADDGKSWTAMGRSEGSRFFHRLVPLKGSRLMMVGGANMESGKFLEVEVLEID